MPTDLTHIRYVNSTVDRWRNIFRFVNMIAHVILSIVLFVQMYACNVKLFDNTLFKTVSLDYQQYTTRLPARASQTCHGYVDCFRKGVPWDQNYQVGFINLDSIQWNSFTMLFAIEWITASMSIGFLKQDLYKPSSLQELNKLGCGNWLISIIAVLFQGAGIGLYFLYVTQIKGYDMFEVAMVTISFSMSFIYILFADSFFKGWLKMLPRATDNMTQGGMRQACNGKVWNIPSKFLNAGGPVLLEPEVHVREGLQGIIWRQLWIVTRYLEYSCTSPPLFVIILNLIVYGQPMWTSVIGYICILSCCLLAIPLHIMYIQEITYMEIKAIEEGLIAPTKNDQFQEFPHFLTVVKPNEIIKPSQFVPYNNHLVDRPKAPTVVSIPDGGPNTSATREIRPREHIEAYDPRHDYRRNAAEYSKEMRMRIMGNRKTQTKDTTLPVPAGAVPDTHTPDSANVRSDEFSDQHFPAATRPGAVVYGPEYRPVSPVPKDGDVLVPPGDLPIARSDPVLPRHITNATPVPVPNDGGTNGGEITEEHQSENESVQENTDIQEIVLMAQKEFQEAIKMNEDIQEAGDLDRGDKFESTRLLGQIQNELENLKVVVDLNTAREKKKIFDNTFSELKTIHHKALTANDTAQGGAAGENEDYDTNLSQIEPEIKNDVPTDPNTLPPSVPELPQQPDNDPGVPVPHDDMTIQNSEVIHNNDADAHDNDGGQPENNQDEQNITKILDQASTVNKAKNLFKSSIIVPPPPPHTPEQIKRIQEESENNHDGQTDNPEEVNDESNGNTGSESLVPGRPPLTGRHALSALKRGGATLIYANRISKDENHNGNPSENDNIRDPYEKSQDYNNAESFYQPHDPNDKSGIVVPNKTTSDLIKQFQNIERQQPQNINLVQPSEKTPRYYGKNPWLNPLPNAQAVGNPWPHFQYPAIISNMFYDYPHWQYSAVSTVDDQPFCNVQPLLTTPKKKVPVINVPIDRPSGLTKRKPAMLGASQGEITYIDIYNGNMNNFATANIRYLLLSFFMLGKWRSNWVFRVQLMQTIWLCISMAIAIMIYVAQDFLYNSMIYGQTRFLVWFSIIAYSGFVAVNALYYTFHIYGKTYDILDVWMDAWSSLVKILITVVIMWGYLHTVDGKCTYNPF